MQPKVFDALVVLCGIWDWSFHRIRWKCIIKSRRAGKNGLITTYYQLLAISDLGDPIKIKKVNNFSTDSGNDFQQTHAIRQHDTLYWIYYSKPQHFISYCSFVLINDKKIKSSTYTPVPRVRRRQTSRWGVCVCVGRRVSLPIAIETCTPSTIQYSTVIVLKKTKQSISFP